MEHWRAVAISACEQCGRNTLPWIETPCALAAFLAGPAAHAAQVRLLLAPAAQSLRLRDLQLAPSGVVDVAIGPEGGFGDRDAAQLREAGFRDLSIGPRILRTETAGIAVLAALQSLFGDA